MTGAKTSPPYDVVKLYDEAVATLTGVERKGASMPYTSINGNMFSFVAKDGVVALRLGPEELDAFLAKYRTTRSLQHGVVQRDYAVVPLELLARRAEVANWFARSLVYATGLKSKATTTARTKSSVAAKKPAAKKPAAKKPAAKKPAAKKPAAKESPAR